MKSKNLRLLLVFSTLIFIGINAVFVVLPGKGTGQMCLNSASTPIGYMSDTDCWTLGGMVDKGNQGLPVGTSKDYVYVANESLKMFIVAIRKDIDIIDAKMREENKNIEKRNKMIKVIDEGKMIKVIDEGTLDDSVVVTRKFTTPMNTQGEIEAAFKDAGIELGEVTFNPFVTTGNTQTVTITYDMLDDKILDLVMANLESEHRIDDLEKNKATLVALEAVATATYNSGETLALKILSFSAGKSFLAWTFSSTTN